MTQGERMGVDGRGEEGGNARRERMGRDGRWRREVRVAAAIKGSE